MQADLGDWCQRMDIKQTSNEVISNNFSYKFNLLRELLYPVRVLSSSLCEFDEDSSCANLVKVFLERIIRISMRI